MAQALAFFQKNVLICYMEHSSDIAERLRAVAGELASLANSISAPTAEVQFPERAKERMAAGKCLNCERKPNEISVIRRGLCQACYQKAKRMLAPNPLLENELISKGLLAPSGFTPNLETTPLDEMFKKAVDTTSAKSAVSSAEKLAADMGKKAKKKGT